MACTTAPLPTTFILSKGRPGSRKSLSAGGVFSEAHGGEEAKQGGRCTAHTGSAVLLLQVQKGTMRLAFQLPRPTSMRPSPCLSLYSRIPAPGFSRRITTPRLPLALHRSQTCAGRGVSTPPLPELVEQLQPTCARGSRGDSWLHRGGAGRERGWGGHCAALLLVAALRPGGAAPPASLSLAAQPMRAASSGVGLTAHSCGSLPG